MMGCRVIATLVAASLLVACSREDVGPSLTPEKMAQAGLPLAEVPAWVRQVQPSERVVCYLDAIEGASRNDAGWQVEGAAQIRVTGWAVDKETQAALQAPVLVVLTNSEGVRVFKGTRNERPDVTAAEPFKQVAPKMAGVTADVAGGSLPTGRHELSFVVGTEGSAVACPLGTPNGVVVR